MRFPAGKFLIKLASNYILFFAVLRSFRSFSTSINDSADIAVIVTVITVYRTLWSSMELFLMLGDNKSSQTSRTFLYIPGVFNISLF